MISRLLTLAGRLALVFSLAVSPAVKADTLGWFFGISGWTADITGELQSGPGPVDVENELGFDTETLTQAYVAFEHFIPLIPNIRLQYTDLSYEGRKFQTQRFDGVDYNGIVQTDFDLTQTDLMAYWRILDNVFNLDIGAQVSVLEGDIFLTQANQPASKSSTSVDEVLPMAYISAGVNLPLTGLSINTGFSGGGKFDGGQMTDLRVSLLYKLQYIGADIGWRKLDLELDDVDGVDTDLSVSGPFIGVSVLF
jgi:outer membrane protein